MHNILQQSSQQCGTPAVMPEWLCRKSVAHSALSLTSNPPQLILKSALVGALLGVLLALAACNGPAPVAPCTVTVSKQAAEQLLLRAQQAYAPGRPLTISANNQEATSLLRQGLEQLKTGTGITLEEPILCFDTGKASLFGSLRLDKDNTVAALIILSASVVAGKPVFKVEQIQLGPVPVPPDLSSELTNTLNRLASENLGPLTLTEIRLAPNQVTVSGQIR